MIEKHIIERYTGQERGPLFIVLSAMHGNEPAGVEALKELAESISVLKKGNVIVEGHTDDIGDASFNKRLSLARSKSVVLELKKLIPSNQFKWMEKGLGESKPIVKNDSEENRAKNRRVEILVVPN